MVSSSQEVYSKAKFLSKFQQYKNCLDELKLCHYNSKQELRSASIFKSEALLSSALLEKDRDVAVKAIRKESAAVTGKLRGVGPEDLHPSLWQAALSKLS